MEQHLPGRGGVQNSAGSHQQLVAEMAGDGLDGFQGTGSGHGDLNDSGTAVIHCLGVGDEIALLVKLNTGQDAAGLGLGNYIFFAGHVIHTISPFRINRGSDWG